MRLSTQSVSALKGNVARIYLVGFMGAGKTTVGRILAEELGWRFFDVDSLIEKEHATTIASLFAAHGEPAFRQIEHRAILRLSRENNAVISLGGGAVETTEVRSLIQSPPDSYVIFLQAPLGLLIDRCVAQDGGAARPLLQNREHLDARYHSRLTHYQNAHLTVATEELTPKKVAAAIVDHLATQKNGNHPTQRSD